MLKKTLCIAIPCTIEMTFEFRAHHPSAYFRFAILLLLLVAINIFIICIFFPSLKSMNAAAEKSIILVVPWLLLLLLPSVILGIIVYRSFIKRYRFTMEENFLMIELLKKDDSEVWQRKIDWKDLKTIRLVDFEDNHYCNLEFEDKRNNLVLHRESGEFEKFYEELKKHAPIIA
ncbi:MAG TPA: hypothetical protein VE978_10275 [Chitinophagales bacterium]|nr:hypothetical protein [Chitinophagales bacterium]